MKTVADYIKLVMESEGAVNTISSGAVATTPTPGKVQKRKEEIKESDAYEGENPLAQNIGKFPLATGATAPDVETDTDNGHMFHQKQAAQQNYS